MEDGVAATVARNTWRILLGFAIVAALALSSTAKAGLLSTGSASYCDASPAQVFSPWGDLAYYASLQNGDFESGSSAWALSGGAKVVSGNEPFYVSGDSSDGRSLFLPAGSSASSGTVCFALGDWHLRLVMRNVGSSTGALRVQVIVPSTLGSLVTVLDAGTVSSGGSWTPSSRIELLLSNVTSLIGTRAVAFRFTPVGVGAAYQIDDVYLDPWKDS
jgi:hypothetical protein